MKIPALPLFVALLSIFCRISAGAEPIRKGDVVVAPLSGQVSDAQAAFLRRALKDGDPREPGELAEDLVQSIPRHHLRRGRVAERQHAPRRAERVQALHQGPDVVVGQEVQDADAPHRKDAHVPEELLGLR